MQKTARLPRESQTANAARERLWSVSVAPLTQSINAGRGERCADSVRRAQIADGVRGPRADASESTRRAECAAPCLSLHVKCLAGGLAFCVAAQGHAARRRLSERYKEDLQGARRGPAWRPRAMQPGGVSANDTRS